MMTPSTDARLRAWWAHRQGLDGTMARLSPPSILERAGWARSVGGVGPYLSLFSRGGFERETIDAAVAALDICELPSARGCTYVLPASDFALGLKVGQGFGHDSDMKVARKLGVTDREIDKLCDAVISALGKQPLDPGELRDQTGAASRSLGPEGKKKGITTTLPLALGKLQSLGEIRRIPINGRLDQQRYRYTLWRANPLKSFRLSADEAYTELARRFFGWIGPATLAEFQSFSGLGVKVSNAAVESLGLIPLASGNERLIFPHDREEFENFKAPTKPQYVLTSGLDGIALLHRDLKALVGQEDLKRLVTSEKGRVDVGGLTYLPSHPILDRGRLIGLWEYDQPNGTIAWMSFGVRDQALSNAVSQMEEYVRAQLGDARSFSLDSPESRAPRIEALRKAG